MFSTVCVHPSCHITCPSGISASTGLSAWKMDLDTEARLTVNGTTVDKVDVAIDPLVWMVGVGRAF